MFKHIRASDDLPADSADVLEALAGLEIKVSFDETDPVSIARAIGIADAAIDARLVAFHDNGAVSAMIVAIKTACRAVILEHVDGVIKNFDALKRSSLLH